MKKRWIQKEVITQDLISNFPEINPLILQLLANRGIETQEKIDQFLEPDYTDAHDPFLFQDMAKSVARIFQAIENKEKIYIYGDYDADGVCASTLISSVIKDLGGDVGVYLPHREKEGYGVNIEAIKFLNTQGVKLIITVDCGSANKEPVELAESLGMNVIVTDHHHIPTEFPKCFAFINPQNHNDTYPFGYICGTGVAFKVAKALCIEDQKSKTPKLVAGYDKWLLDLVAIATIADMMPLVDENHILVKYGLIVLSKTRRPGLKKMMEVAGLIINGEKPITTYEVGFMIAPRINAAGRIDHANLAYALMIEEDMAKIEELAGAIEGQNQERRDITEKIFNEAVEQFKTNDHPYLLVAYGENWPIGLAGLVASKLLQKYGKPVIVMTKLPDRIAGSGRSIPGFDMAVMLDEMRSLFTTAGGHAMACGFSFDEKTTSIQKVIDLFQSTATKYLEGKDLRPELVIDAKIKGSDVTWNNFDLISTLEPYGKENPKPVFMLEGVAVVDFKVIGDTGKHLKLKIQDPGQLKSMSAIGFNFGEFGEILQIGQKINIAFTLDCNEWNGNKELQLQVEDLDLGT